MTSINRLLTNICAKEVALTKAFYTELFDFEVSFDSDWFVHLVTADSSLELGIIDINSDIVPVEAKASAGSFYITMVIEDVDEFYPKAVSQSVEVIQPPQDTAYGQRRLLIKDPNGVVLDVSSLIKN